MTAADARFQLTVTARDGRARRGRLVTAHGVVNTPAFMPVGTAATVKAMTAESVAATGAEVVLCNTYHLMLRPGPERIAALGGLHRFMNWPGTILTNSGGYQVMSLSDLRKIDENGVSFKSHLDGTTHLLTPERAIEIQHLLDSTITMVLDECTPFPATEAQAAQSMQRSMRWASRCKAAFPVQPGYALFGIVQGGVFPELRRQSAEALKHIGFDGYAVGGLAVGEGQTTMFAVLDATVPHLPDEKPRYLMGVGKPADIVGAVLRGIDMFDCVLPTRSGRTGQAFTRQGTLNLRNSRHADDPGPIDPACQCGACRGYSRAYIAHLVRSKEILGAMLLTQHNLRYYQDLMVELRTTISDGRLDAYADAFVKSASIDEMNGETAADSEP